MRLVLLVSSPSEIIGVLLKNYSSTWRSLNRAADWNTGGPRSFPSDFYWGVSLGVDADRSRSILHVLESLVQFQQRFSLLLQGLHRVVVASDWGVTHATRCLSASVVL